MQTKFELSSSWFPETYSQEIRVPKFLCARYQFLDNATGDQLLEWHVWWSASPRLWRMIRITVAAAKQREDRGTMPFAKKDWTSLQYLWASPTLLTLPCSVSHLSAYIADKESLAEDVTNLTLRLNDQTQLLELCKDDSKPYEPEDVSYKSTYRSAEYLMNAQSLGCRIILEREVVIKEIVSGFTATVLINGQACVEKKLPLATVHLEPFLYELKALYMLRHCPSVIEFVGVEVDNTRRMLQGFIRALPTSDLSYVLRHASMNGKHIPWPTKEKWAKQLILGLLSAHKRDLVVGTLDVNEIGFDEQLDAKLLHVGHGRCDLHSGCLAPELRVRLGLPDNQGRLSDAHMTARQDIFALGLVLWLIADPHIPHSFIIDSKTQGRKPWWKRLFCQKAHCLRATSTLEAKPCAEDHTNPVDLPPCDSSVPMYFQHLINRCRTSIPNQRATAQELMAIFKEHARIARE
jgi:serine/threonine protein kinase